MADHTKNNINTAALVWNITNKDKWNSRIAAGEFILIPWILTLLDVTLVSNLSHRESTTQCPRQSLLTPTHYSTNITVKTKLASDVISGLFCSRYPVNTLSSTVWLMIDMSCLLALLLHKQKISSDGLQNKYHNEDLALCVTELRRVSFIETRRVFGRKVCSVPDY